MQPHACRVNAGFGLRSGRVDGDQVGQRGVIPRTGDPTVVGSTAGLPRGDPDSESGGAGI